MKKLFLLDAMAMIYRAHFAFSKNPRINSKGMNTGAVLGFTNSLVEVLQKENPTHIGIAFDTAEPTFRHIEYKEYKANREEQPEDITNAIPYIYKMVEAFKIPALVLPGYEADDIIGTIAKRAAREGFDEVYMMTIDKDYAQLVEDKIFLYKPSYMGNGIDIWDVNKVLEKFDIERVDQVIDFLGMQGDAVDNIPGIPGVGPKTAVKFLKSYGSVEGLLENTDKLKGKQKEKVEASRDQALLSKKLATINIEVPIDFSEENLKYESFDKDKVKALFEELEFRTLTRRLFKEDAPAGAAKKKTKRSPKVAANQMGLFGDGTPADDNQTLAPTTNLANIGNTVHHYYAIDTPEKRAELIAHLKQQDEFCFDTETTSLVAQDAELVGIAFATYAGEAYYVPTPADQKEAQAIVDEFKEVFEDERIGKIAQNLKYDLVVLKNYGVTLKGKFFDTMIAHYLLQPDMRHNMDVLAKSYLNYEPVEITSLIGKKGKKQGSMRDVAIDKIKEYAGEDADITLQLKEIFDAQIKAQDLRHPVPEDGSEKVTLEKLLNEVETPLIEVLATVETNGVKLDSESLAKLSKELAKEVVVLEEKIYKIAGEEFNIASPKQLGEILFGKLQLDPKAKKTKSGQYATGEEILVKLADKNEIVQHILDFRGLQKLKNTYVDALPELVNAKTGLIHTSYNQAVAATGRLSSTNPNLQNIPIRTAQGREVRRAFIPRSDEFVLLAADYSQIELRIMAEFSQDATMIAAFQNGEDIHATTASKIYKVPLDQVDSDMRRKAKTANFGIIYGISAHGLSERLNIPRKEAGEIIKAYFEEFPAVKQYMDDVINKARKQEYVETILGRRRYLRNINSRNAVERGNAERNAINAPIQGSAADMIKIAMIRLHEFLKKENLKSKMILQVHDELVFDAHKDELDILKPAIEDLMKNALSSINRTMAVPMEVEIGEGQTWLEAH
ncbi:DNA polymerase I [uncultured Microscilla sp.]|uniref:DNA polymerase I n=1 Tax=uncultured Microscilla sp. TaxID=432653 RepID=UPI002622F72A|nr:DNA polymerase I [uncultured Microscilla sp.]